MLCSDGTADVLDFAEIAHILKSGDPGQAAGGLIARALEAGAADNVTTVVLRMGEDGKRVGASPALFIVGSVLIVGMVLVVLAVALRLFG